MRQIVLLTYTQTDIAFYSSYTILFVNGRDANKISIAIKRFTQTMCKTRKVFLCAARLIETLIV